jgi:hypothetical protein
MKQSKGMTEYFDQREQIHAGGTLQERTAVVWNETEEWNRNCYSPEIFLLSSSVLDYCYQGS